MTIDTIEKIIVNFSIVRKEQKEAKYQKIAEEKNFTEFIVQNDVTILQYIQEILKEIFIDILQKYK